MSSEDLTKPVAVPAIVWKLVVWAAGILGAGAVGTIVVLVNAAIGFSGRLSTVESERISVVSTVEKIERTTEATRTAVEDVKRDVAVLKARP